MCHEILHKFIAFGTSFFLLSLGKVFGRWRWVSVPAQAHTDFVLVWMPRTRHHAVIACVLPSLFSSFLSCTNHDSKHECVGKQLKER